MEREFTYTKEKLQFILGKILSHDIRDASVYGADDRAEEGFEKRAALEFVLWFLDQAFPPHFSFACKWDHLESEYPETAAARIVAGGGWAARHIEEGAAPDNVVFVDFKKQT